MKHRNGVLISLAWMCCLLAVFCAAVAVVVLVVPSFSIRFRYFLLCVAGAFAFPAAAALLRSFSDVNEEVKKRLIRGSVIFVFIFYVLMFLFVLLFARFIGNGVGFALEYNKFWLEEALPRLVPFSSLSRIFKGFALGRVSTVTLVVNVLGNFFLYTPLAFFIPSFSRSMRSLDSFLPCMVFVVIAVELVQGMFGLGSFETDDIILGICGALCVYSLFNFGPIGDFFKENHFYF